MTQVDGWEAAEIAASLTTYIAGIEATLKQPMMQSLAYLVLQVDEIYDVLQPIVGEALDHAHVNMPWDGDDD
jgi:hypothetical protein